MDTNRFTTPITDHLPTNAASSIASSLADATSAASSIASSLADATTGLAGQIGDQTGHIVDHVGDIDVAGTVQRGRRLVARVVPGMSPSRARFTARHWVIAAVAVAAVVAVVATLRRRSSDDATPAPRDDWATPSSNGVSANPTPADRADADADTDTDTTTDTNTDTDTTTGV